MARSSRPMPPPLLLVTTPSVLALSLLLPASTRLPSVEWCSGCGTVLIRSAP